MKKHDRVSPAFLEVDFHSTVKIPAAKTREIQKWLNLASPVVERLIKNRILPGFKGHLVYVSLMICGDSRMKKLNSQYRNKDLVTDVLSFPSQENLRSQKKIIQHEIFLGDLAICHSRIQKQAREFSIGYMDEFIHLFFHGLIHLMGFDHELSKTEEKLMQKWEKKALAEFSKIKKGSSKAP